MATQAELELVFRLRDQVTQNLSRVGTAMRALGQSAQQVNRALTGSGGFLGGVGVGAAAGGVAAIGFAFDSMEEQARLAFTTILGSGDKANALIDRLKTTALEMPFAFSDVLRASQRLVAAGFDPTTVDQQLTTISDAISSTGDISRDKLEMMTGAFARMRMTGVFSMEAIQELGSAGVNVLHLLAEQAGVSDFAMQRTLEHMSGRMPAGPMMDRVMAVLKAKYGGLSALQAQTMQGVLSNIRDLVQQNLGAIMLPIFVRTRDLLTRIFYYMQQVRDVFKALPTPLREAIKIWGAWLLILVPVALAIAAVAAAIGSLVTAFAVVGAAVLAAVAFLTPFGPAIALIAIVALTLYEAWTNNWFGIRDVLTTVWGVIGPILQSIWDFVYGLATGKISLSASITTAFDAGWAWVMWLGEQAGKTIATAWSGSMNLLGTAWDVVTWVAGGVAKALAFSLEGWLKVFGLGWDDVEWLMAQAKSATAIALTSTIALLDTGWTYVKWAADNIGKSLNWDSVVTLLKGGWDYLTWAADNLGKSLNWDSAVSLLTGGWDYLVWAADNLGKTLSWDSAVSLAKGGWDYLVWAADNLGKTLSYDSAVSLLTGGWTYLRWAADNIGKTLSWDSAVSLLAGGWDYVKKLAGWLGTTLKFDLSLNIGWVNEWVHKILNWIADTGGKVLNVGGSASGQSALVAAGVAGGGGGSGGDTYVLNFNAPVYANDIEDQVVAALDAARRKGRTG